MLRSALDVADVADVDIVEVDEIVRVAFWVVEEVGARDCDRGVEVLLSKPRSRTTGKTSFDSARDWISDDRCWRRCMP